MSGDSLVLKVEDFQNSRIWRWVLENDMGKYLADHEVSLDPRDWEYGAFISLDDYLKRYSSPDKWIEDQERILKEVGCWIGREVFGPIGNRILDYGTPVTVQVKVPSDASGIATMPLELAYVLERPLALQDVSLVFEIAEKRPKVRKEAIGDCLRILAVFSLPYDVSALSLRRERYELAKLIREISQNHGRSIELRVLQYGVTRELLRDVLEEKGGWDIVHLSGHGERATLLLEKGDGSQDSILSDELVDILQAGRGRLKLVTLASCLSAASTIEETLRWLGIKNPKPLLEGASSEEDGSTVLSSLAWKLVHSLDCAVLAMRYPVGDEFAISLNMEIYKLLLDKGQLLTRSLQLALPKALGVKPNAAKPPLSVATPALFGDRAMALHLNPPMLAKTDFSLPETGLDFFEPEPQRFVGRIGVMAEASFALAPKSGKSGVLFYGMAGGGKSSCALELAHHYSRNYRRFKVFVWYKAPNEGEDVESTLLNFALAMENQLPGFTMAHLVNRVEEFEAWLPRLTRFLEERSVLIVLDNLESLLTSRGHWRDQRWEQLIKAMLAHRGLSRVVLTSRRKPAEIDDAALAVETINPLSLGETALLARELPNLGRLLRGDSPVGLKAGRDLVSRTLALVQGHPKLIEFAEGLAKDPKTLEQHLERATKLWGDEGQLKAFFKEGESSFEAEDFLEPLIGWTHGISGTLSPEARIMFHFLCALEEVDRQSSIVIMVWPHLWSQLKKEYETPNITSILAQLVELGLVDVQSLKENVSLYKIHPGVAAAGANEFDRAFQAVVHAVISDFWGTVYNQGLRTEEQGGGSTIVKGGLRAAPYLIRQQRWDMALKLLDNVIPRDESPKTANLILPVLYRLVEETAGTEHELMSTKLLVNALRYGVGRQDEAEEVSRSLISKCISQGNFRLAIANGNDLVNILRHSGRFQDALDLDEEMSNYALCISIDPWYQLGVEARRLQILNDMGRFRETRSEIGKLRVTMQTLPEDVRDKLVSPWNVKEIILGLGSDASAGLGLWDEALMFNDEKVKNMVARGASEFDVSRSRFNDFWPLLQSRRIEDARELLLKCRKIFEKENDVAGLGRIFGSMGIIENIMGHSNQAIDFQKTALRYNYLAADNVADFDISHDMLAKYLISDGSFKEALAHRLASVIINYQVGSRLLNSRLKILANDFSRCSPNPPPLPVNFDELCKIVETVEGVHFREIFEHLPRRAASGDEALQIVVEMARKMMKSE